MLKNFKRMPVGTSFWLILSFFKLIFQSVSSKLVEEFKGTIWTVSKKGRVPDHHALHDEAELKNYLTEKKAKYNKVCANRYDSHKLQRPIDNQKNIPEAGNSVEASPSLSR